MNHHVTEFLRSLEAQNASVNTVRAYRSDLKELLAFIGSTECAPDRQLIRRYLVHLNERRIARSSVARKLAVVQSFFRWATAEGIMETDVAHLVRAPKVPKVIPRWPSEQEVTQLLDGDILGPFPERDRAVIELLYATGVRVSELSGINTDDFREVDVLLVRGKWKKERFVIFGEYAQAALRAYLPAREKALQRRKLTTNALFFGLSGRKVERLTTRNIARIVKNVAIAKGLPPRHPHSFRHAYATHMLDHGASLVHISKLLGHAKLSRTQRYTHISTTHMMEVYNQAHPHGTASTTV